MSLEKNFISPKIFLSREKTPELQALRDRVFKEAKVKSGKGYQQSAIYAFEKALEWSKNDGDMSFENLLKNFKGANNMN